MGMGRNTRRVAGGNANREKKRSATPGMAEIIKLHLLIYILLIFAWRSLCEKFIGPAGIGLQPDKLPKAIH
jgi:hypothetical protein